MSPRIMLGLCISLLLLPKTLTIELIVGQTIKLRSVNKDKHFVSRSAKRRVVISDSGVDNEWIVEDGLIGQGISLQSVSGTGYIRHKSYEAWVDPLESGNLYKKDASFIELTGLAGIRGISLRSVNHPRYFLRHHAGEGVKIEMRGSGTDVYTSFEVVVVYPAPGESINYRNQYCVPLPLVNRHIHEKMDLFVEALSSLIATI